MKSIFTESVRGYGQAPQLLVNREYYGDDPTVITDGGPFAVTNVNCTPAVTNVGGFPAIQLAGAGAATDGSQTQVRLDGLRPRAGKVLRMYGQFHSAAIATHQAFMGFAAIDTSILASAPSDYIGIIKATSTSVFSYVSRKASGTAENVAIAMPTLLNDTWYDYELLLTRDLNTAGMGRIQFSIGASLAAGGQMTPVLDKVIATQFPDTVDLSASRAFLAGSTVTTAWSWGQWGWQLQR